MRFCNVYDKLSGLTSTGHFFVVSITAKPSVNVLFSKYVKFQCGAKIQATVNL
jgi:hypothetical protein